MMVIKRFLRNFVIILGLLFLIMPVYAGDLKADGSGATVEEARIKAKDNLSEYINGSFVQSTTSLTSSTDNKSEKMVLSSFSGSTTNGYVKAVEYENEYKNGGVYYSTAIIRDNNTTISVFRDNLNNLKRDIEKVYGAVSSEGSQQKKSSLITVYGLLTEYEAYKTILVWMGHSEYVPSLSFNISTTSIYIEYQNIIIEEGYELEEKEKYITDETEHQKLLEELSANRTEQRRIEREKNEAMLQRENAAKLALEERLRQYSVLANTEVSINLSSDEMRYASLRENIISTRTSFLAVCKEYDKLCKEQFAQIDKDYEAEKKAVEARPYRYAELDGDEPTLAAKKIRDDEIAYLYSRKEMHKVAVMKQVRASLLPRIKEAYDEYKTAVSALDDELFEIILGESTISKVTTSYDSVNVRWNVSLCVMNIEGISEEFNFTLGYKQLTGNEIKEARYLGQDGYNEYMAFLDDIDYLDTIVRAFTDSFRISIKFKASAGKESYGIGYAGIDFEDIQFVLESNALNNQDWSLVIDASPATIQNEDLSWTLPGYSRIFNSEFDV